MLMRVEPSELREVISFTPGISPSRRSSVAATVVAMVSGSAPGRLALTLMVGKSTVGMLATGRKRYATTPTSMSPMARSTVPTGRRIAGSQMFMTLLRRPLRGFGVRRQVELRLHRRGRFAAETRFEAPHLQIADRRRIERQELAQ